MANRRMRSENRNNEGYRYIFDSREGSLKKPPMERNCTFASRRKLQFRFSPRTNSFTGHSTIGVVGVSAKLYIKRIGNLNLTPFPAPI